MAVQHPPTFINAYLSEKIPSSLPNHFKTGQMGFFPTTPTDITALTETFPQAQDEVFAVYDRMLKMRKMPFPHIKSEQLLYYFYKMAGDPVALIETTQIVQDLLDREDESAEEVNRWIKDKQASNNPLRDDNGVILPRPYFHRFKIYQLQETRDIVNFGTARTYAGNKIIIDYDWHQS